MDDKLKPLLADVSEESPCGLDLTASPEMDALLKSTRGDPPQSFETDDAAGPDLDDDARIRRLQGTPPNWKTVEELAIAVLLKSKSLRAAVILTCALTRNRGLPGLCDGLEIIHTFLKSYWVDHFPRLRPSPEEEEDPSTTDDPTQRINFLRALALDRGTIEVPQGSSGVNWLSLVDHLYWIPLTTDGVVLDHLYPLRPRKEPTAEHSRTRLAAEKPEFVARLAEPAARAAKSVDELEKTILEHVSAGDSVNFSELKKTLNLLNDVLASGAVVAPVGGSAGSPTEDFGGKAFSGSMTSRGDVERALSSIAAYYRAMEPGSPIPLVVDRVRKMVSMNFVALMREMELTGDDLKSLQPILGSVAVEIVKRETPPTP